jgi:hypothetical protein
MIKILLANHSSGSTKKPVTHLLSTSKAAAIIGISEKRLIKLIKRKSLTATKLFDRNYIHKDSLERYLNDSSSLNKLDRYNMVQKKK